MKYLNNPLNIRFSPLNMWLGVYKRSVNGFCEFSELKYGVRAAAILLMRSYRKKGCRTYAELIHRFAPSSENPTNNYIMFVCHKMIVMPFDCPKDVLDYARMIFYMWRLEQGQYGSLLPDDIASIINDFGIKIWKE